jgi:transcriptional regulator with XRE-family HTH domain
VNVLGRDNVIGLKVRELRISRGKSVRGLAAEIGVSAALLSQVERGITDPSLDTLRKLSRALDVPLFSLFGESDGQSAAVVRSESRMRVRAPRGGVEYSRISAGNGRVELLEGRLDPGGSSSDEPWSHPSDEVVVVIEGVLLVEVAEERHRLGLGDSCSFDSRRPHRYVNPGPGQARFLVAITPPSY